MMHAVNAILGRAHYGRKSFYEESSAFDATADMPRGTTAEGKAFYFNPDGECVFTWCLQAAGFRPFAFRVLGPGEDKSGVNMRDTLGCIVYEEGHCWAVLPCGRVVDNVNLFHKPSVSRGAYAVVLEPHDGTRQGPV